MAKYRIAVMQRAVAEALHKAEEPDPLAESDAVDVLDDFRREMKIKREHGRKNCFAVGPTQETLAKRLIQCQIKMIQQSSSLNKMSGKSRKW